MLPMKNREIRRGLEQWKKFVLYMGLMMFPTIYAHIVTHPLFTFSVLAQYCKTPINITSPLPHCYTIVDKYFVGGPSRIRACDLADKGFIPTGLYFCSNYH